jgi:hypothetical protein
MAILGWIGISVGRRAAITCFPEQYLLQIPSRLSCSEGPQWPKCKRNMAKKPVSNQLTTSLSSKLLYILLCEPE